MRAVSEARAGGARLESLNDGSAVIVRGRPPRHLTHLILAALTMGAWAVIWVALELFGGERRELLSLNESGEVVRRRIRRWSWWTAVAVFVALGAVSAMLAIAQYG